LYYLSSAASGADVDLSILCAAWSRGYTVVVNSVLVAVQTGQILNQKFETTLAAKMLTQLPQNCCCPGHVK